MRNSVLDALDIEDETSELILFVSGYRSGKKFMVLVEGIDDVKAYEKVFAKERVRVHPASGCYKLMELVKKLDEEHLEDYFISIKDADFDHLNHVTYPYPNLFVTDTHDMETMMVDEDVVESVMKENLIYEKVLADKVELKPKEILNEAISKLKCISYIRWYNDKNKCNWNFCTFKIPTMYKEDTSLGYSCCISFLKRYPGNKEVAINTERLQLFEQSQQKVTDDLLLVQGHDMCEMICILIQEHGYYRKSAKLNSDKVEAFLRIAYTKDKFRQTKLYSDLMLWFANHDYCGMMDC